MIITFLFSLFSFTIFIIYIIKHKSYNRNKITKPQQALAELIEGNKRYNSFWNFFKRANRKSVAMAQRPFAIVLSCSDSRVPTEIIFNQLNLGNLFIIRNAGNVIDGAVLGSIEYGVEQLGALLIIVLGHERCSAVTATIDSILTHSPEQHGHIKTIINAISPAAETVLKKNNVNSIIINEASKINIINETVQENVKLVIQSLFNQSQIITEAVKANHINIVGAYYDLNDGDVIILD